jgi:hypothetical protein
MATFPTDQFDDLPEGIDRVGAHRGPRAKGGGWIAFAWAALATVVLIAGGLFVLASLNGTLKNGLGTQAAQGTPLPSVSPTPTTVPISDPRTIASRKITVTVLNGTDISNAQVQAGTALKKLHWNVGTEALASESTIKKTTIYYSDAANKDVAEGVQIALGTGTIQFSNAFAGAPITVVIGKDYTG